MTLHLHSLTGALKNQPHLNILVYFELSVERIKRNPHILCKTTLGINSKRMEVYGIFLQPVHDFIDFTQIH